MRLSIFIPVYNEADNILPLLVEVERTLAEQPPVEIIVVDDGSDDETPARLREAKAAHPRLRVLRHDRRSGQSAALATGVRAATGDWIATLDGDGQNDPADLPRLIAMIRADSGLALVGGLRQKRNDSLSRRLASRIANSIRQAVLRDRCPDSACGLKLFRREAILSVPTFDGMHRFLPALFLRQGHPTAFVAINHRPRRRGVSKVTNAGRAMVGITDLLGVWWLIRRARRPAVSEE